MKKATPKLSGTYKIVIRHRNQAGCGALLYYKGDMYIITSRAWVILGDTLTKNRGYVILYLSIARRCPYGFLHYE